MSWILWPHRHYVLFSIATTVAGLLWRLIGPTVRLLASWVLIVPAAKLYVWCLKQNPNYLGRAMGAMFHVGGEGETDDTHYGSQTGQARGVPRRGAADDGTG